MEEKKRVGVYLPIEPTKFKPIKDAIKAQGKDIGFEALKCLLEVYGATQIHSGEGIHTTKGSKQS